MRFVAGSGGDETEPWTYVWFTAKTAVHAIWLGARACARDGVGEKTAFWKCCLSKALGQKYRPRQVMAWTGPVSKIGPWPANSRTDLPTALCERETQARKPVSLCGAQVGGAVCGRVLPKSGAT